ncbi:MAG: hypothetical protein ABW252_03610 [Polyangiales bacterium]
MTHTASIAPAPLSPLASTRYLVAVLVLAALTLALAAREPSPPGDRAPPTLVAGAASDPARHKHPPVDRAIRDALEQAIRRADAAEIDALETLDTTSLRATTTGPALDRALAQLAWLEQNGMRRRGTMDHLELRHVRLREDKRHAEVDAVEVWTVSFHHEDGRCMYRWPTHRVPQILTLDHVGDRWMLSDVHISSLVRAPQTDC